MINKITAAMIICVFSYMLNAQTGINIPEMTNCDNLVNSFMTTHNIPGVSFSIAKNGKLIYQRAFGNADIAGTEITQPHHLFRIASISKPITSIAIMNLVEQNQISLSDKVFGTGGLLANHSAISNATITDSRIYDITVQHLLEHSAGWDRGVNCFPNPTSPYPYYFSGCDPIVAPLHVTQTNSTTNPATEDDMIVYLLEKGLDFTPNSNYAYSNIGYLVLGEIIEEISGQSYENYVKGSILNQLGICDMHLGENLIENKKEREVEYVGNGYTTLSCYNTGSYVPWEYGGFNIEAMGAHGGWIATSRDLVNLLLAVDGFTTKPDILSSSTISTMTTPSANNSFYAKGWSVNPSNNWWHTGALDGTASIFARTSGQYTWTVLLNKREIGANANQFWTDLDNLPWNCIAGTSSFPTHDLLDIPTNNSTNINFPSTGTNSVSISWTNGDGNKRIVVARENNHIEDFPLDGESYIANASFSFGDDLGNNSFVVYNGTGNTVNVNNLQSNTTYYFRVFEYNESSNTGNNALYKLCGGDEQQVSTTAPLPIDLTDFSIAKIGNLISLFWSTASEVNNSHFEVEKSTNGIAFDRIGLVLGKGNSTANNSYSFEDKDLIIGTNYYRIKQVDFNGSYEYTSIKSMHINSNEGIKVYPTLANNIINIEVSPNYEQSRFQIYTLSGILCKRGSLFGEVNAIQIADLNEGMYILQVEGKKGQLVREKFIKN